ncbi:cytochrome c oxidase accessory protein CcoG [Oligella ureolytica]
MTVPSVFVCPTGIDIRNGLQYMCIGCGACIDACDDVMDKMDYPRGLIRYTSENSMAMGLTKKEERKRLFKPRTLVYLTLLIIFITGIVTSLALRNELRFDVVRDCNSLGREVPGGYYENVYRVLLVNMTSEPRQFVVDAEAEGLSSLNVDLENSGSNIITVSPRTNQWIPVIVRAPVEGSGVGRYDMDFNVRSIDEGKELKIDKSSSFFVPK